jgi:pyruvate/2-oxoglutarate dehydrogenase complex dihydrolipoamide acyltransferase (E2) component
VHSQPTVRVDIPLAKRRSAEQLQRAHQEIPSFYVFREARADQLAKYCKHLGVSPTARLLAMVASWLTRFPDLNAHWTSELKPVERVNLGLAVNHTVGPDEALVVVTFHDCANLGVGSLSTGARGLAEQVPCQCVPAHRFHPRIIYGFDPWRIRSRGLHFDH